MFNRRPIVAVTIAFALLSIDSVSACGDKLLIVGRGSRFQRAYVAVHPASLLLVNSNVTAQRDIQSRLKIAGHRMQVVNVADVARTYAAGRYDFILADFRDVHEVSAAISNQPNAVVLPVIDASSKNDWDAASKRYKCLLEDGRGMKSARQFLAALDLAMESKHQANDISCDVKLGGR